MKTYLVSFFRAEVTGVAFGTTIAKGRIHTGNLESYQIQLLTDVQKDRPETTSVSIVAITEIEDE